MFQESTKHSHPLNPISIVLVISAMDTHGRHDQAPASMLEHFRQRGALFRIGFATHVGHFIVLGLFGYHTSVTRTEFNQYLSNPQHWNRFTYVLNNPLKYLDPDGWAEELTVNVNIVYDKNQFTEEQARKATAAQVADLKKVYGGLDIVFNVNYTPDSANALTEITEGARDGNVNVFFSQERINLSQSGGHKSQRTDIHKIGANQGSHRIGKDALSHEMGHKFGMTSNSGLRFMGVDLVGNLYSDFHIKHQTRNYGAVKRRKASIGLLRRKLLTWQ